MFAVTATLANAQSNSANPKILVINGSWSAGAWDLAVTSGMVSAIREGRYSNAEVSIQYLGLNTLLNAPDAERQVDLIRSSIEAMIEFQNVSMVIAIASSASNLALNLNVGNEVPKLLLIPSDSTIAAAQGRHDVAVVQSAAPAAIESTIEQILDLKPNTETIHIAGGTNADNLAYVRLTHQIAEGFSDRLNFEFHLADEPDALVDSLNSLGANAAILALPISSYTNTHGDLVTLGPARYESMLRSIDAPVFSMYDTFLEHGITGGQLSSAMGYARTIATLVKNRVENGRWDQFITEGGSDVVYDWQQVERFNLNLDRLRVPYALINEPTTLFDTNPTLVIVGANVLVFLVALICIMALLLDRTRKARDTVAASEKLARENEEKYRLLATNTVDVIWTWNLETREVTYCSPSVEKLSGFTADEILEKKLDEIFTPESAEYCLSFYRNSRNPRNELIEVEHYTSTGETVWCELAAHPVNDDNPHIWVGVTRDISQRKLSEEHHAKLEASVRQNQKFESLGTLAGGIAHDFNNILTVMVGLIEMLGNKTKSNGDLDSIVSKLSKSTNQATRLVQRILTFSRQKEGEKSVLDMAELTRECAEFLQTGIPPRVTLNQDIPEQDMPINADKTQVEQIILNIITNAIEALDDKGGEIGITLEEQTISQTTELKHGVLKPGQYAKLSIVDNGAGIPADQMEKIFDPFHTSKELGNGMGLAIVRSIIIQHEGAIGLSSIPGHGTTFDIYLPLSNSLIQHDQPADAVQSPMDRMRILVIDDQENVLEIAEMLLKNLGHDCIAMDDPIAAFEYIKRHHENLDMVITDYSMPKLNGIQIVKFCEQHFPDLPAILSTGYGESMSLHENGNANGSGKIRILKKPYSYADLRSTIEEVSVVNTTVH